MIDIRPPLPPLRNRPAAPMALHRTCLIVLSQVAALAALAWALWRFF